MRSRCRRSIMTMSAPSRPSSMSVKTSTPSRSMPRGSSVDGATTRTRAPMRVEHDDVGAGDARMQDVAADRHRQPGDAALGAADGERVEQRLRRMLMRAVAGIDHRAIDLLRQQLDRAGGVVAHDQDVGPHGVQRHRRVDQRLALLHRGGRHVMFMTSAPSRLPASSKELCVRVEASKNRLIRVRPRSTSRLFLDLPVDLGGLARPDRAGRRSRRAKGLRCQQMAVRTKETWMRRWVIKAAPIGATSRAGKRR